MLDSPKGKEGMLKANSVEFADSLGENHSKFLILQPYISQEQRQEQAQIELEEKKTADSELDNKLIFFSEMVGDNTKAEEEKALESHQAEQIESISIEDQVKYLNRKLKSEGKSTTEILQILLSTYGKEEFLSTWVENWKNFQELHEFSKTKPPKERQAIERIMTNSDFTSESAFSESLDKIALSKEISKETKKEIALKFGRSEVTSMKQMDGRIQKLKAQKKRINKRLKEASKNLDKLSSDVKAIEKSLSDSSISESEREELESQKERLSKEIKSQESVIADLKEKENKAISFPLRDKFKVSASKGKRYIQSIVDGINVQLPSNRLPFSDKRNLDSVNCCFLLESLNSTGLMEHLIKPKFKSGDVPSGELRLFSTRIIEALGLSSSVILSQEDIDILNQDLLTLAETYSSMTPFENLKMLQVIDVEKGVNQGRFFELLNLLKDNRETEYSLKIAYLKVFN